MCGLLFTDRRVCVDHDRMLELEELTAMDEGSGVGTHAVVRTTPRHEVQLARLDRGSILPEALQQRDAGFGGQRSGEELRPRNQVRLLRRWIFRIGRTIALRSAQVRPELPGLCERHPPG